MATRTISTKLAIDGEAEYRASVSRINSELKTLSSELKLVESNFKGQANSQAALTAKGTALQNSYSKQSAQVKELKAALENAQKAQQTYSTRIEEAKAKLAANDAQMAKLKSSTTDTTAAQTKLSAETEKLKKELADATAGEAAAAKGVNDWQQKLNNAQVDLNNLSSAIKDNDKYLGEAKASTDGCAKSIDEFGKETKKASDESEKFGKNSEEAVSELAAALAAAGVTASIKEITSALLECSEAALTFEAGVAKISTLVDTSTVDMGSMSDAIISLSSVTGISAADLSEATYQAMSAGVDAARSVEFVSNAVKLAEGGFTSTTSAVDVLTTAINAYGLSAEDATAVSDMLIITQNLGKTTVDQLSQSLGTVIPLASGLGVNIENLSASYAVLTKNGIKTEEAGTYIRGMLNELGDTSSGVAKVLKEQTGKSFATLTKEGLSLGDVLGILNESAGNNGEAFKNLWSNVRAGTGALSIINSGAENFNNVLLAMQNSAGATDKAFQKMEDTAEHSKAVFEASANNLKISIGNVLLPSLNKLRKTGASAFDWAADFVKENPWMVSAITSLIVALEALAVIVAGYTIATKVAIPVVKAFNAALAANPIMLVATALVTLTTALITFTAMQDDATDAVEEHIEAIKESKEEYEKLQGKTDDASDSVLGQIQALKSLTEQEHKATANKQAILGLVDKLNAAVPNLSLSYDSESDSLNMTSTALIAYAKNAAEAARVQEKVNRLAEVFSEKSENDALLEQKKEELEAYRAELELFADESPWEKALSSRHSGTIKNDIRDTEDAIKDLEDAGASLDDQISGLEGTIEDATDANDNAGDSVDDLILSMQDLETEYEAAKVAAKDSLDSTVGMWDTMDNQAVTSVADVQAALDSQVEWLTSYRDNLDALMSREIPGVDTSALVQSLSDGSTESAAILAGLSSATDTEVANIAASLGTVETLKDQTSTTMGEAKVDFGKRLDEMEKKLGETVDGMDMSTEAGKAASNTMQAYINDLKAKEGPAVASARRIAAAVSAALNNTSSGKIEHNATGTDYSADMFIAGENGPELIVGRGGSKVWTAEQTAAIFARANSMAGQGVSSQTINHTGTIRVEGINNQGEFISATEIVLEDLRRGARL